MIDFGNSSFFGVIEQFIRGPMVWASFLVFGLGIIAQCRRMINMTQKREKMPAVEGEWRPPSVTGRLEGWLIYLRVSILGTVPWIVAISFLFHVLLLTTPLLVAAHNVLLETAFGVSFVSVSEKTGNMMTVLVLFCGGFFLLRRIFSRKVRAISTPSDFMLLALALAPFMTGFLACQHVADYPMMVTLHILSAEILLVIIPFSRFSHMIFFFISRLLIIGEHGRKSAGRVWQYQQTGIR